MAVHCRGRSGCITMGHGSVAIAHLAAAVPRQLQPALAQGGALCNGRHLPHPLHETGCNSENDCRRAVWISARHGFGACRKAAAAAAAAAACCWPPCIPFKAHLARHHSRCPLEKTWLRAARERTLERSAHTPGKPPAMPGTLLTSHLACGGLGEAELWPLELGCWQCSS